MKILKILLMVSSFSLTCCDEEMFYDYIIQNDSGKSIHVQFETYDIPQKDLSINEGETDTIFSYSIIEGMRIYEQDIIFNRISISCDTTISRTNFMANETWDYRKKSNTHAVYFLKIDSTFF